MAEWIEYRTLQVNLEKQDGHIVEHDSAVGDPKTRGRMNVPLVHYLNLDEVGRSGWEMCGVIPGSDFATVILMRRQRD